MILHYTDVPLTLLCVHYNFIPGASEGSKWLPAPSSPRMSQKCVSDYDEVLVNTNIHIKTVN